MNDECEFCHDDTCICDFCEGCTECGTCYCDEDEEIYNEEDELPPAAKPLPDIDMSDLPF
jgi:hypothetical protein